MAVLPLTVSMTPSFCYEGDWLLRAQLKCLSEQTFKDFSVMLIDAHFSKRRSYMPELAEKYGLRIEHIPYDPNPHVAKRLDCSIFNAAYCYSESPRIVRYSCWRFVKTNFTKVCVESPTNVDFYFHSCSPKTKAGTHPETGHDMEIFDLASDNVNWDRVPKKAGDPGATWTKDSDIDAAATVFPTSCFGNYCVSRKDWLSVNGCEEAVTAACHYEDMDFTMRAKNKGLLCSRKAHALIRLHHQYGNHAQRANIPPDQPFKALCASCEQAWMTLEPQRFDIRERDKRGEIVLLPDHCAWVCKTCFLCGPIYHSDPAQHLTDHVSKKKITQSNIIPQFKLGRNLVVLTSDMDGKSLPEKWKIFNNSWGNERYYQA